MSKEPASGSDSGSNGKSGRQLSAHFVDPGVASAISWMKGGHSAGCFCRRCVVARGRVRNAVQVAECNCGGCLVCWARGQMLKGRL